MKLGEPDLSGRPRPVPIEGSEYEVELDSIIVGIGQGANPLLTQATKGLDVDKRGRIMTEEVTQMTSIPGVFAGGDIVTGAATVILAMGAGKLAARSIDCYLRGVPIVPEVDTVDESSEIGAPPASEPPPRTQNSVH
jgi:glutamate synthase (NADPH/NADH) small chain